MAAALPIAERGSVSGVGIGLRSPHFAELLGGEHSVPWLELLADNHLASGGLTAIQVEAVAERYPLTLHCVGMNLGGVDPLDFAYLRRVRDLAGRSRPAWISDHLCFTRFAGHHYHDLLPFPYTTKAVRHVAERVNRLQDFFDAPLLVENVSAYLKPHAELSEAQFLRELVNQTDCQLLLDVNNLYVNQHNLGTDPLQALCDLPLDSVREIHLAGFEDKGHYLVDAHNNRVAEPVWQLFAKVAALVPQAAVLIEWDNDIPTLSVLLDEAARARAIINQVRELAA